jgi:membrane-associated phospholipid phosphatase
MHMTSANNPFTPSQYALNQLVWGIIACCAAIDAIWMATLGIGVDFTGITPFFIGLGVCITLSVVYGTIRKDPSIWLLSQVAMQLMISTPVLGALSYLAARTALPLIDEQLIAIDHALGFDWKTYIAWVNRYPLLADILSFSYTSAGPQMLLVLIALFFTRQTLHIQRFTVLFVIGSLLTLILANLLPAVAGYIHYDIDISAYPNLHPAAERAHEAVIFGMRDHSMNVFSFPVKGIVTFPSFHSTVAILLIYACWPIALLRYISIPLNLLVLMSTPVDGGHYFIDVIGGVAIAFLGIWWAHRKIHA